jgi:hypothetical protein
MRRTIKITAQEDYMDRGEITNGIATGLRLSETCARAAYGVGLVAEGSPFFPCFWAAVRATRGRLDEDFLQAMFFVLHPAKLRAPSRRTHTVPISRYFSLLVSPRSCGCKLFHSFFAPYPSHLKIEANGHA